MRETKPNQPGCSRLARVLSQHQPGVLHRPEPAPTSYGYPGRRRLRAARALPGCPSPGETIVILGAVYAGTGHLNVFLVGLLAYIARRLGKLRLKRGADAT